MNHHSRVTLPILVLLAAMVACNLPAEQVAPPGEVQTAAALTVQAVIAAPSSTEAAGSSPSPAPAQVTVSPTNAQNQTATTTITPTYSVPMLTVRENTNCRTGPGEAYQVVFTYTSGKKLEVVGRYDPGNFWLVKSAESPTGNCWLWGEYVDVVGSYWAVSSVTPPPTATGAPPRAPSIQEWNFSCSGGTLTFILNWKDMSTGETGYRVFREGEKLAELPANSTTYTDTYDLPDLNESVEYYLQVYSPAGTANSSVMSIKCGG
ncbi:MAG TPA: SH3 domain-containing protein [Anaerolineales bacterium]|nr:SH3 domain-containing protein [Anaerolineales bacterium]